MNNLELLDWFIDLWDRLCDEYKELYLLSESAIEKAEYMAKIVELRMQKGIATSIKEKLNATEKENNIVGS